MRTYTLHEREIPFIRDFRALNPVDQEIIRQIVANLAQTNGHSPLLRDDNVVPLLPRPALS